MLFLRYSPMPGVMPLKLGRPYPNSPLSQCGWPCFRSGSHKSLKTGNAWPKPRDLRRGNPQHMHRMIAHTSHALRNMAWPCGANLFILLGQNAANGLKG